MIVYGRNAVHEALRGRRATQVREIWATHGASSEPWLRDLQTQGQARAKGSERAKGAPYTKGAYVRSADIQVHLSTPAEIERRCGSSAHQGVCAEAGGYPYVSAGELLAGGSGGLGGPGAGSEPLIVALDEIQDPQNLGSIARTAECVGANGLVIPERRAAEVTPAACKASAGAVEHLRIARVRNLADFLGQARDAGCWCYGACAAPRTDAAPDVERKKKGTPIPYDTPDYRGAGVVLVLGSEGHGLRPRVAKACDELIALPVRGQIQSLNVSAAAAALMYEILQRRAA